MIRFIVAAAVMLDLVTSASAAGGLPYEHEPIHCLLPLDSANFNKCRETKEQNGNSGHCVFDGTRAGKEYTIEVHVSGHDVPFRKLPALKNKTLLKGALTCEIVSSEMITGVCNAGGNASGGSGHCIYCVKGACHEGSASIRIREKKAGKNLAAE